MRLVTSPTLDRYRKPVRQSMYREGLFLEVERDHSQDPHHDRASPSHLYPGRLHACPDCPAYLHYRRFGIPGDVSITL